MEVHQETGRLLTQEGDAASASVVVSPSLPWTNRAVDILAATLSPLSKTTMTFLLVLLLPSLLSSPQLEAMEIRNLV